MKKFAGCPESLAIPAARGADRLPKFPGGYAAHNDHGGGEARASRRGCRVAFRNESRIQAESQGSEAAAPTWRIVRFRGGGRVHRPGVAQSAEEYAPTISDTAAALI